MALKEEAEFYCHYLKNYQFSASDQKFSDSGLSLEEKI